MSTAATLRSSTSLAAATDAVFIDSTTVGATAARAYRLQAASTPDALIGCVPSEYADVLRGPLMGIYHSAAKLVATRTALARLRQHHAVGTFPDFCKQKAPQVQFTKEFGCTSDAIAAKENLAKQHREAMIVCLDTAILAKANEVMHFEQDLAPQSLYDKLSPLITTRTTSILGRTRLPIIKVIKVAGTTPPRIEHRLDGWRENDAMAHLGNTMLEDCVVYAYRMISMAESKGYVADEKSRAKKSLQTEVDAEMADASAPGPSIQSLVDKAVSARLKALKVETPKKVSRFSFNTRLWSCGDAELVQGQADPKSLQGQGESQASIQVFGAGELFTAATRQVPHVPLQRAHYAEEDGHRSPQATWRNSREEWEGKGAEERREKELSKYLYPRADTIPDWLLTVPRPLAIHLLILNTPVNILLAAQFKFTVHMSPGVILPDVISQNLSVGMNYMFYQPTNPKLIKDAWKDFERRIRWRLKYSFEQGENEFYDPEYEVRNESDDEKIRGPILPLYLELGLRHGRRFVDKTIATIPEEEEGGYIPKTLSPPIRRIQEFLVKHEYVVTNTDKNLGLAVSKRSWLIEKCKDILSNSNDYKVLSPVAAGAILRKKCDEMLSISYVADITFWEGNLPEFLRSKITPLGESHHIPRFYGIPKIHKEPVKMRPIIPCHSAVMNPAAKYVSKKLKPIVKSAPTIIHGSKDLATKLSKLNLHPTRQYYILTGDVVAFYPNIPLAQCLEIVTSLYDEFMLEFNKTDRPWYVTEESKKLEREVFVRCLEVGNTQLITQFDKVCYQQLRGLAMGVADSPDLANLYGWWFERLYKVLENPLIPFYGRYIDDCLALVYAESEHEALAIVQKVVKFDSCTIEWNVSLSHQPFLDMLIYRDIRGSLQHMPYRKARNHQERIPWISFHPLDVKRGTFIGEMSRLATLSSTIQNYKDALSGLVALYVHRGYPENLVMLWLKNNVTKRWEQRLHVHETVGTELLVLKTEYNKAWNYFNATELTNVIFNYWKEWLARADRREFDTEFPSPLTTLVNDISSKPGLDLRYTMNDGTEIWVPDLRRINILNRRIITSRKRTRNLFDLTGLWKTIIFEQIDEKVLEDAYKRPETSVLERIDGLQVCLPDNWAELSSDDEVHTNIRSNSPKVGDTWTYGRA